MLTGDAPCRPLGRSRRERVIVSGERFQVLERLGEGGGGSVYRGHDRQLDRPVALKFLTARSEADGRESDVLLAEARAAASFNHPGIATVLDVARLDGRWCIVSELVEGETLASRLARAPLAPAEALDLAIEIASTLSFVHAHGWIHGDLKPSNVLLTPDGGTKLVDFGLARASTACVPSAGRPFPRGFSGTAGYAAPEAIRGARPDARMDVYSLGSVLYEALSGRRLHDGTTPPIAGPDVPLALEVVVRRALASAPEERYASMEALSQELRGARDALASRTRSSPEPGHTVASGPARSAFRGLLPFQEADQSGFFGREAELRSLLQRITHQDFRFGVLYGESGCGKTSLIRAGLLPALWEHGDLPLYCRPFGDPLRSLVEECRRRSRVAPAPAESPLDYVSRVGARESGQVFLVWDPLEEFFVSVREPASREPFLSFLGAIVARGDGLVRCLACIRSDFLHLVGTELARWIPEPLATAGLQHLPNLDQQRACEVLERSARRAGLGLEAALVAQLARDLASEGSVLPSELQIVGERLESRRIHTLADYRRAGGREALVFSFVDDVVRASGDARSAGLVLRCLISEEDTRLTQPAAAIVRRSQLSSRTVERLLGLFVEARIVREVRDADPWHYELVHEYLIGKVNQVAGRVLDATRRANRLLRQYASAQAVDPRTRIPLRHAWFIRRHGGLRPGPRERALLARSLRLGLVRAASAVLGLVAVVVVAAAALSLRPEWEERRLRDGHMAAVRRVVFSPDGRRLLSGGEDGEVILWDFARRRRIATLSDHEGWVRAVAFSRDGRRFASLGADQSLLVFDAATQARVATLAAPGGSYSALAFSPDGELLAAGGEQLTRLWSARDWAQLRDLPRADSGLVFSNLDPPTLYGSAQWAVTLGREWTWPVAPGSDSAPARVPGGNALALSPDGRRLAAIDGSGDVIFTSPLGGGRARRQRVHRDHGRSVAFSPDGRFFASAAEDVLLWDAKAETWLARLEGAAGVWSVDFSPDGRWLVVGHTDGDIVLWDVPRRERLASLTEHHGAVRAVAFSGDGQRLASAGEDRSLILWDVERGRKQAVLTGHTGRVNAVAWLPDGTGLASCDFSGEIVLWDAATHEPRWRATPAGHMTCNAIAVAPDGRLVATPVGVFETAEGRVVLAPRLMRAKGLAYGLAFSPDGSQLLSGNDRGDLILYDTTGWSERAAQRTLGTTLVTVAYSPDGRLVATGEDDGSLRLWHGESLRPIAMLGRAGARLKAVAFTSDGRHLASAGDDQVIRLWDVARRRLVTTIGSHRAPVLALSFSPDGRCLASGGQDRSVHVFTRHQTLWGQRLD